MKEMFRSSDSREDVCRCGCYRRGHDEKGCVPCREIYGKNCEGFALASPFRSSHRVLLLPTDVAISTTVI